MNVRLRSIGFKIAIMGLILCFLPVMAVADQPAPKAVVETDGHDFGTVLEGNDVIHEFVIKNTGDAPLAIKDVRSG